MAQRRYELTDEQWEKLEPYFKKENKRGRPYKDLRATVNGIIWILRSGAAWEDIPTRYGNWNTIYKCFAKWAEAGIFEKVFKELSKECDLQDISIDSTIIKVHQDGGSKKNKQ